MKIYTRTGDSGETSLFGGDRVSKEHARVEAYGALDELNSWVGVVLTELERERDADLIELLNSIQSHLFVLGSDLATPEARHAKESAWKVPRIQADDATPLEAAIDRLEASLPPLRAFILPGGAKAGALLHVARTVCRRAERRAVALANVEEVNPYALTYLNRLSDLLFVLARTVNARSGQSETEWNGDFRLRSA